MLESAHPLPNGNEPDDFRYVQESAIKAKDYQYDSDFWRGFELYKEGFDRTCCDNSAQRSGWQTARIGDEDEARAVWLKSIWTAA